jgi:FlgD Ig-like domain
MKDLPRFLAGLCFLALACVSPAEAFEGNERPPRPVARINTNGHYAPFLINNVFNYYYNNGEESYNPFTSNSGFEFPKGSEKTAVFSDGIMWGGFQRGELKVGGSYYGPGLQAGRITVSGTSIADPVAAEPGLSANRVYRVRPDISPGTPFLSVQSKIHDEELGLIGRYVRTNEQQIYDQYIADWKEWPASEGAPFEDRNGNGTYEWDSDIPGKPGADQTLWYVANDLDSVRAMNVAGSHPLGLEMQKTIWGYRNAGWLDNAIFVSTRLVNKSGARIDSMFLAQWADPDLGEASDDYVGCDTAGQFGYVYNSRQPDGVYGYAVPSFGSVVLQGPRVVSAGDTAIFLGQRQTGFRNLRIFAFPLLLKSHSIYGDPRPDDPLQWYLDMNGFAARTGQAYVDPTTGAVTRICFSGDPVTGSGWIDGGPFFPGDRRFLISCGPFAMTSGDTQEIVMAHMAAQGADRLASITLLRSYMQATQALSQGLFQGIPPGLSANVTYPSAADAKVSLRADCRRNQPSGVTGVLLSPNGETVAEVALLDDGAHGDSTTGDGIWGNSTVIPRQPAPLTVKIRLTLKTGETRTVDPVAGGVSTAGEILIEKPIIFSDNLNGDGKVNPGENIRYGVTLENLTPFTLSQLTLESGVAVAGLDSLRSGATRAMQYVASDSRTYFSHTVSAYASPGSLSLPVTVIDGAGNVWRDTVAFPIEAFVYPPRRDTLTHTKGSGTGSFEIVAVDPLQFKGHTYSVQGVDSINSSGDPGFSLLDVTDGRVILRNHPLPDSLGHAVPVTDGFRLLRGSTAAQSGRMVGQDQSYPSTAWRWGGVTNVLGLEGFGGTVGNATEHWWSGGAGYRRQHSVRIRFARTDSTGNIQQTPFDTLVSFAYRYLENANVPAARSEFAPYIKNPTGKFAYQDYAHSLPFAAYDVDVNPPRRLMVGYLENNVANGRVDAKYWPPVYNEGDNGIETGPREWFYIFDVPYSQTPEPTLAVDISTVCVPLMWIGYPARESSGGFSSSQYLLIHSQQAPGSGDEWTLTLSREDFLPATYTLMQNYPNPFNPNTTIAYTLPVPGDVTLTIYNILGQQVQSFAQGSQYAGQFTVVWDGKNNAGVTVSSGVYFYRLDVQPLSGSGDPFMQVKKMMVVR